MSINKIKNNYDNRRAFTTRPDRAIEMGGFAPGASKDGTTIQMAAGGTSTDFGDLTNTRTLFGGMTASSTTRALFYGGEVSGGSNEIDSMQLASTGNASDHGDLTVSVGYAAATSNGTRALVAGGNSVINTIGFGSIAQTGNFADFGDLTVARNALVGICSPVRAVFAGGTDGTSPSPAYQNVIDYVTINSTGNATDFGDLSGTSGYMGAANDSSGKGFFIGGNASPATKSTTSTDVITIASTGNAQDFGVLTQPTKSCASVSQGTTAITMGGSSPSNNNVIQRFVMPSLGNATDFGDLSRSVGSNKGGCGSHDGIDWGSVAVQRPSVNYMPGSGRVLMLGGNRAGGDRNTIDTYNINTFGNSFDFGDLVQITDHNGGCASLTRAFSMGGVNSSTTIIQAVQFANQGNAFDFGDLTIGSDVCASLNSTTRGINAAGYAAPGVYSNIIDYITMATAGNASDFGDLTVARADSAPMASSTRGIFAGGEDASNRKNTIDYITIASTGNATDFGDTIGTVAEAGGLSSGVRGVMGGGSAPSPSVINVMAYVTIASTGNMTDFGDLTAAAAEVEGSSTPVRGCFMGGRTPSIINTIQYITIASTGNAIDFGDMSEGSSDFAAASDSNGGLQA